MTRPDRNAPDRPNLEGLLIGERLHEDESRLAQLGLDREDTRLLHRLLTEGERPPGDHHKEDLT